MILLFSCRKATRLISDEMEHPLGFFESAVLRSHIGICGPCARYRKQVQGLMELLRQQNQSLSTQELSAEAKARLSQMLKEQH